MIEYKILSKEQRQLLVNTYEDRFFDLTKEEEGIFQKYFSGSVTDQTLEVLLKYLEDQLLTIELMNRARSKIEALGTNTFDAVKKGITAKNDMSKLINSLKVGNDD